MKEEYKLGNTTQEFEELFGNVPFEDIEKIKKWLFNNFIPISVIQNKIDWYKAYEGTVMYKKYNYEEIIQTLQKLLEEGKK